MQTIINIAVFVLILGLIIFIHELGHFITAKKFGVYCSEFSLGMGPKLFSKKVGETEYELRALPIGGFVAMAGEIDQQDNEAFKNVPYERTINGIKTWQKVVVMLAGVFMNFVLAIVVLVGIYNFNAFPTNSNILGGIVENSPAAESGLQSGDEIITITIDGTEYEIESFTDIASTMAAIDSEEEIYPVYVTYVRGDNTNEVEVASKQNEANTSYLLGIKQETKSLSFYESISNAIVTFGEYASLIFIALGKLITDTSNTVGQLSGPAGIYQVSAEVTESGDFVNLFNLMALLSINIGIFNLLPIPGLDGSQVIFALIEKVIGREIPVKLRVGLQIVGMALIFGLMIFVTINDINKFF